MKRPSERLRLDSSNAVAQRLRNPKPSAPAVTWPKNARCADVETAAPS
jgi:hypothetical protein